MAQLNELTPAEMLVYEAINSAAENDEVCPQVLDLLELIGCESLSTPSVIVKRLEGKQLIRVIRYQRFRRVQIVATGKWTARSPSMHKDAPQVPRGAHDPNPLAKALCEMVELMGFDSDVAKEGAMIVAISPELIDRFARRLERVQMLTSRRLMVSRAPAPTDRKPYKTRRK